MLYELTDIVRNYGGRNVLDLSLSLEEGRVTGLIGPNGSGKTTLLEILAFLAPPTSGEVRYRGARVDFGKSGLIRLRRSAVLVQQKPILFTRSVFTNVEFPLKIRDVKKSAREKTVNQLLAMVGMERFISAAAEKLSGGETQRVAIAQALACSPDVILMDEPTASVDVENRIIIEHIIRDINRLKGISVIFTTHDMIEASRIADDIIYLNEGKIAESVHENIFSGGIETDAEGGKFCVIQEDIRIPVKTERSGRVRVSINPDAFSIHKSPGDVKARFSFRGRVIQLSHEKGSIRVLVDIGVPITVIMPSDNKGVLPGIGEHAWLTFDPEKIEFL